MCPPGTIEDAWLTIHHAVVPGHEVLSWDGASAAITSWEVSTSFILLQWTAGMDSLPQGAQGDWGSLSDMVESETALDLRVAFY